MKRSVFAKVVLAMAFVFLVGACSQGGAIEMGETAPDFSLNDIQGKGVKLSDFKGKVIILDFFASWCPPCRQEVPDFIELEKAYGSQGFAMIGVALVSREDADAFAKEQGINYPVLVDDGKASAKYGPVRSIPTTFIIDKDFKVTKVFIGYRPKATFENEIKELLK